jgi:hypothetical protein
VLSDISQHTLNVAVSSSNCNILYTYVGSNTGPGDNSGIIRFPFAVMYKSYYKLIQDVINKKCDQNTPYILVSVNKIYKNCVVHDEPLAILPVYLTVEFRYFEIQLFPCL